MPDPLGAPLGAGAGISLPRRLVVVHWNQPEACLETVDAFTELVEGLSVTVVDNGSEPAARGALRDGVVRRRGALLDADDGVGEGPGPALELVEVGCNAGFGPGANIGLQRFLDRPADGEWVLLAPHDVDPHPDTVESLAAAVAGRPMAGLCSADVGDGMAPVIDPYFGGMVVPGGTSPGWEPVDYPHGTLMMLRRATLAEVGLFDPRYFSYCEEADLSLRARAAGWEVGLVRGARVENLGLGSSVWLVDYLQTRNTLLLVQEMSGWYHAAVRACFTVAQVVRGLRRPDRRPAVFDPDARFAGMRDFALRRFGPPPAR